jgi:hypothetical protein
MGKENRPSIVLDAGALIAFERADPRMRALAALALRGEVKLVVPAGVVAQVSRNGARQVPLRALVRGAQTRVLPLDLLTAEAVGALCGRAKTRDVVDASVVLAARQHRAPVVTSDPRDLLHIDPTLEVEPI